MRIMCQRKENARCLRSEHAASTSPPPDRTPARADTAAPPVYFASRRVTEDKDLPKRSATRTGGNFSSTCQVRTIRFSSSVMRGGWAVPDEAAGSLAIALEADARAVEKQGGGNQIMGL